MLSEPEWIIYNEMFNYNIISFDFQMDGFIYLKTNPEICQQRCQQRSRKSEIGIVKEYFEQLHQRHEEWLDKEKDDNGIPILSLNGNEENDSKGRRVEKFNFQVQTWIKQIIKK